MDIFGHTLTIIQLTQFFIALFLGICFLQSGLDKVFDYWGNLDWLNQHFGNSMLKGIVPPMLIIITVLELGGGALCLISCYDLFFNAENGLILYGFCLCAIALTALFFGQRMAKDYEGASILVIYFILTMLGLLTFSF